MDTKGIKAEFIKVRVTLEQKEKFKKLAKKKGVTVSEIICNYIEKEIELQEYTENYQEEIDKRVVATEDKIDKLKKKMGWI